ncbi:MAG: NUDIX hydrolase [Spirochaetaceae bacterium]
MPEERAHLLWKERSRELVYEAKIFDLHKVERESADGRRGSFVLITSADWVHVVALTTNHAGEECFVVVRQFRQGARRLTMEFPGGIVDEDEKPEDAARRELEEETGYVAEEFIKIGEVSPNPAIQDNTVHTFLALDAHLASDQSLDEHEIVDAELVPVAELDPETHPEFFVHAIMVTAMYWYEKWKARRG